MNEKSVNFRQKEFSMKYLYEDWVDEAVEELRNNRKEVLSQAEKFLKDEEVEKKAESIEAKVDDRFSPSNIQMEFLNNWQRIGYSKNKAALLLSLSWALNQYSSAEPKYLKETELYPNLPSEIQNSVIETLEELEDITPPNSMASFSTSEKSLHIYYLPREWLPENYPSVMEPLMLYLDLNPNQGIEDSVLHELTHAFIKENTRKEVAIHNDSLATQLVNDDKEDLNNEPAAIDEAAAHAVSKVISGDKKYNARGYEVKGGGLPRDNAHTAFNIFIDIAKEKEDPYKAIGKIRELASKSIDEHFKLKDSKRYQVWMMFLDYASKLNKNFEKPDSPLEHLKLLAEEEIEDFNLEKYEVIEKAAEAFEKSERLSLNFLIALGLIPQEEAIKYGEHKRDTGVMFPIEDSYRPINAENAENVDLDDLNTALEDLENLPDKIKDSNTQKIREDLSNIINEYKNKRGKFNQWFLEDERWEKKLEEEERNMIISMISYDATGPENIDRVEGRIEKHLLKLIHHRLEIIEKGESFTEDIMPVMEDVVAQIRARKSDDNLSKELEYLNKICKENLELCNEGITNLREAKNSLEEAEKKIKNSG